MYLCKPALPDLSAWTLKACPEQMLYSLLFLLPPFCAVFLQLSKNAWTSLGCPFAKLKEPQKINLSTARLRVHFTVYRFRLLWYAVTHGYMKSWVLLIPGKGRLTGGKCSIIDDSADRAWNKRRTYIANCRLCCNSVKRKKNRCAAPVLAAVGRERRSRSLFLVYTSHFTQKRLW